VRALRNEGVRVVEYQGWRTNNRNHKGDWGPVYGVMIHHTVTSGTDPSVRLCYGGRSDLPGPLCHGVIAKDGTVHLVGNGRANHAGLGDGDVLNAVIAETTLPRDNEADTDGNKHFYGFEAINLGDNTDPWPDVQVEAIVRSSAALCRAHGWCEYGSTSVIGHSEWQLGKVDPRGPGFGMEDVRARVAERLKHNADWNQSEGDSTDMPEHIIFERADPKILVPGDWWTISWDRFYTVSGGWKMRDFAQTLLSGPNHYVMSLSAKIEGLDPGQEVLLRIARNSRDSDGNWERRYDRPESTVTRGWDETLSATYSWTGYHPGANDARLVADIMLPRHVPNKEVTAYDFVAEINYWPVP